MLTPLEQVEQDLQTICEDMARRGLFVRNDFGKADPLAIADLAREVVQMLEELLRSVSSAARE